MLWAAAILQFVNANNRPRSTYEATKATAARHDEHLTPNHDQPRDS